MTGLWPPVIVPPPAGGRWYAVPKGERVLKVLKFDGPSGRGWWIALMGNAYKVSVTGLAFCVIWHDKHSGDWLTAFATPYSAVPDFSTGKHVTRFSGRFASLRIVFPCHPYAGGQNKTPRDNLLINPSLEMTVLTDTPIVISTAAKRSGEISPSDGTGGITAGDLSTQRIIGAVPACPHTGMRLRSR